jgi:hypothetical protein
MSANSDLRTGSVGHGSISCIVHSLREVAEEGASPYGCEPGRAVHGEVLEVLEVDDYSSIEPSNTCFSYLAWVRLLDIGEQYNNSHNYGPRIAVGL